MMRVLSPFSSIKTVFCFCFYYTGFSIACHVSIWFILRKGNNRPSLRFALDRRVCSEWSTKHSAVIISRVQVTMNWGEVGFIFRCYEMNEYVYILCMVTKGPTAMKHIYSIDIHRTRFRFQFEWDFVYWIRLVFNFDLKIKIREGKKYMIFYLIVDDFI